MHQPMQKGLPMSGLPAVQNATTRFIGQFMCCRRAAVEARSKVSL
jgi:hypothetical protein